MNCRSRFATCKPLLLPVCSKKAGAPCTRPFMLKLRYFLTCKLIRSFETKRARYSGTESGIPGNTSIIPKPNGSKPLIIKEFAAIWCLIEM